MFKAAPTLEAKQCKWKACPAKIFSVLRTRRSFQGLLICSRADCNSHLSHHWCRTAFVFLLAKTQRNQVNFCSLFFFTVIFSPGADNGETEAKEYKRKKKKTEALYSNYQECSQSWNSQCRTKWHYHRVKYWFSWILPRLSSRIKACLVPRNAAARGERVNWI